MQVRFLPRLPRSEVKLASWQRKCVADFIIGSVVQWIRIPDFGSGDEGSNPSGATRESSKLDSSKASKQKSLLSLFAAEKNNGVSHYLFDSSCAKASADNV